METRRRSHGTSQYLVFIYSSWLLAGVLSLRQGPAICPARRRGPGSTGWMYCFIRRHCIALCTAAFLTAHFTALLTGRVSVIADLMLLAPAGELCAVRGRAAGVYALG